MNGVNTNNKECAKQYGTSANLMEEQWKILSGL